MFPAPKSMPFRPDARNAPAFSLSPPLPPLFGQPQAPQQYQLPGPPFPRTAPVYTTAILQEDDTVGLSSGETEPAAFIFFFPRNPLRFFALPPKSPKTGFSKGDCGGVSQQLFPTPQPSSPPPCGLLGISRNHDVLQDDVCTDYILH